MSWESFVAQLAVIAHREPSIIAPETRLVADLGLDSLAITELAVALMDEFGVEAVTDRMDEIEWEALTVGRVFDDYVDGRDR